MPVATDPLSLIFQALADPTRRGVLERLSRGEATVGQLAEPFAMSAPAISQHLAVLERAGLITRERKGTWRVCTMQSAPLQSAEDWVRANRAAWESRFDRLDDVLARITSPKEES